MSNTHSFWGGATAFSKDIRRLEATSFKALVESYIFIPILRPHMSRSEFHAHTIDEQKKIKDCPYICACTFREEGPNRGDVNAEEVVLAILDLDEGGGEFVESPSSLSEALYPWNFAAWTTASHTEASPRLKVMVEVRPCNKSFHKRFVKQVAARLGLNPKFRGSIESKVLSQPQYRPISFRGEEVNPVIASRIDGIPMDFKDLPEENELDERVFAWSGDLGSDLAYLPVNDLQVEDIREPLFAMDPDISYKPWTEVAAALRHQFRDEDDARSAYELFDEWSSTGSKYKSSEDTFAKWRSFNPDTMGKAPITIRSLFWRAAEAGWDNRKIVLSFKNSIINWMKSCTNEDTLLEEGCRRIAAMPFPNDIVEDLLVQSLRKRIGDVTSIVPTKKAVEDFLARTKKQKRAEKASKEVPNWLQPFCYVSTTNRFRNAATGVEMSVDGFNNTYSIYLISKDAADENANAARPSVLPQHYALNQIEIKRVDGVMYDPRNGGAEPYFTYDGKHFLNTYLPSSLPEEDPENSEEAGRLFLQHLDTLIEEREYRDHVLHHLCHVVQFPGVKIPWVPIIQSAEGAGKGYLLSIMKAVLGAKNVTEVNSSVLEDSKFNAWMVGSTWSILNEVHIPGARRISVMNSLKMFISDTHIPVRAMYSDVATDQPNLTNSVAFTNFHEGIYMSESDRRWMPIESKLQSKEDIEALNATGHFTRMEPLKGRLGGALRHWMLNYKIPDSFPRHGPAPHTIYRREVIESSKNPMLRAIEELIETGADPLVAADIIHGSRVEMLTAQLARSNGHPSRYIKQLGFIYGGTATVAGGRTTIWTHRKRFDSDLGTAEEQLNDRCKEERMIA